MATVEGIRPPAVAGRFYPEDPAELAATVDSLLEAAPAGELAAPPTALIVPHAGYTYSGAVAAAAFRALKPFAQHWRRVVLIGPAHYVPVPGLALAPHAAFATPLGLVRVDREASEWLWQTCPQVAVHARAHAPEHALEVELPFLQRLDCRAPIVPLLFGGADDEETAAALDRVWDGETLLLVSSDLSHYEPYEEARRHDAATAAAIEALDPRPIGPREACGYRAIRALLRLARARGLEPRRLALANSGDAGGERSSVVGYGAWAFIPAQG